MLYFFGKRMVYQWIPFIYLFIYSFPVEKKTKTSKCSILLNKKTKLNAYTLFHLLQISMRFNNVTISSERGGDNGLVLK